MVFGVFNVDGIMHTMLCEFSNMVFKLLFFSRQEIA